MSSNKWDVLPLDEDTKKLGKISRVRVNDSTMEIYNGKTKPITFSYNESTSEDLYKAFVDIGYTDQLASRICTRLINALGEYTKKQAQKAYELDGESTDDSKQKNPLYLMKYTKGIPFGIPAAEAIILGGTKSMWLQIIDGKAKLSKKISSPDGGVIQPWEIGTYLSKEYEFASEEEINSYIARAKKETLDTLYNTSKSFWLKYIDADNYHHVIGAADTIFTYFVDKSSSTHYLLFVGDVEAGKSNNLTLLEHLSYRALPSISLTHANIYRSYGTFEEAQVTILEDEIDNIEDQDEKKRIYKSGYKPGAKVYRNDDTPSGRKSQAYLTYGFKAFTSEKRPDSKARGLIERTFVIKCLPGYPEEDISEVIACEGDEDLKAQFDELVDFRKILLVYRLLHFNDPIPNIGVNLKNRSKQLCKPLLRLFQGTKAVDEIKQSLWQILNEKKSRKANSKEARIYRVVDGLVKESTQGALDEDEVVLTSAKIRESVIAELKGDIIPGKPMSWTTEEYGTITQHEIASIAEDILLGKNDKKDGAKIFIFSKKKLAKIGENYSNEGIAITVNTKSKTPGRLGPTGRFRDDSKGSESDKVAETVDNHYDKVENTQNNVKNVENLTTETTEKESQHSDKGPKRPKRPEISQPETDQSKTVGDKSTDVDKSKTPEPRTDGFTSEQKSTFWQVFDTESEEDRISDDRLHDALCSTGRFTQSDAAIIIRNMAFIHRKIVEVYETDSASGLVEARWKKVMG